MKTQQGFTLIEMVAVIIILAIMSATALPRFVNMTGEARYSSLSGLVGGLRSAVTLSKSKWMTAASGELDTVMFNVTGVSVINLKTVGSDVAYLGAPLGATATGTGIDVAMDNWGSYTSGVDGSLGGGVAYWPANVAVSSNCYVSYQSGVVAIHPATGATAAADCS